MNMIQIDMPEKCRYMSDYDRLLKGILPIDRKFILNKTITGCGGTSMFINSSLPVVIISPRIQVLKEKHKQHPDTFLFHIPLCNDRAEAIREKMQDLGVYLDCHQRNLPFGQLSRPPRIQVTLDSSDKVLSVLKSRGVTDTFLFVVDEFQCLMGDATFKGSTDMNFLVYLDREARRICYLSATPIPDIFLDNIPQFAGIPYYKLEWDPEVIEEPTLKEVRMKSGESAEKLCARLIQRYRENGYFERKVLQGNVVYSREACIFLNEVRSIRNIIGQNNLKPDEVTILCSESKASELPKGFVAGGLCADRNNPVNKTFTFCTKASFEGVDFYSTNASTYIFINAGKEWQTLDIMLDIPQILGRQRLDMNPFRHDATIYYKTMPERVTKEEFERKQSEMERKSQMILDTYNNAPDNAREMFVELYRDKATDRRFVDDYIDLIRENGYTTIGFNYLVMVARWNRWHQRNYYYNNSCRLLTSIQDAVRMCQKPEELKQFESWYYNAPPKDRLAGYARFRKQYPQYDSLVLQNPFIKMEFHHWYATLGYEELSKLGFQETDMERAYNTVCAQETIRDACRRTFKAGVSYSRQEVKGMLQKIYDSIGLTGKTAKAKELAQYLPVIERQRTNEKGKRRYFIEIREI
jgi:hypothetical protein